MYVPAGVTPGEPGTVRMIVGREEIRAFGRDGHTLNM